ncbi:MAG TPA: ornithine cyclodeaminase family protein [Alcaligenaceae bacterium]|nr:ornithine cyclodeaminase family protein [Alcaligenaceae bacterium]
MQFFDQSSVAQALPYPVLIDALATGLQEPIESPLRSHYEPNHDASTVLIMPAWKVREIMGVKLVSVWPGNNAIGQSAVSGAYVLISCVNGNPIAVMDGTELTLRRTASAAALAAKILSRKSSSTLAILGTGSLSLPLAEAHASVMQFSKVLIWGRDSKKSQSIVDRLASIGIVAQVGIDLKDTLSAADVVAVATTATTPFVRREWLKPGTHLGLMGAFTAQMAEADPELMPHAQVFVDSRDAILEKGGEVFQAIQRGLIHSSAIEAQLSEISKYPQHAWRKSEEAITVFKSVGFASLDLIAADLVYKSHR